MFKSLVFIVIFVFFSGCGEKKDVYKDNGDSGNTGDTSNTGDSGDTGNSGDSGNSANTGDSGNTGNSGDDGNTVSDNDTGDTGDSGNSGAFWTTCEGIILCQAGCADNDELCKSYCYNDGTSDGKKDFRLWKECFEYYCAEKLDYECAEEKCPEESAACNISADTPEPQPFPAPYGIVNISGSFKYILDGEKPTEANQFSSKAFATGNISSKDITPKTDKIYSYVIYTKGEPDILEIFQVPFVSGTQITVNPVIYISIEVDKTIEGSHDIGIDSSTYVKLMAIQFNEKGETVCHHAFGIGKIDIKNPVLVTGSDGRLEISAENIELFSPKNIPSYGGDAQDYLRVKACSLIK